MRMSRDLVWGLLLLCCATISRQGTTLHIITDKVKIFLKPGCKTINYNNKGQ